MTKWFDYNNEDGTPGNSLPSSVNGPYYFEYNSPGTYRSDIIRSIYAELQTIDNQQYYYIQSYNPDGTYGVAFDEDNQITLVAGTTYYLAGFFRFEQIDGKQIWHNSSDYDKLCGMQGSGFRWIIESGFGDVCNYLSGKTTFTASVATSSVPSWPTYDHLVPNVGSYNLNNPPYCDYSHWYAVVMGVTVYTNSNGRVRLWINGNLTTDTYGQTMETGATFFRIEMNGTMGQGEGDAPAHKRQFDRIILTDNWQDIIDGGYLSDPEGGSASPSLSPSESSSDSPSLSPSASVSSSNSPSISPSISPSNSPSISASISPSYSPSLSPSLSPSSSQSPSLSPSISPSLSPSISPSISSSRSPSMSASESPSESPSESSSLSPSSSPSESPSPIAGEAFVLVGSPYIVASGENTTAQLTPPSGKTTGDFQAGRIQDDENPIADTIDLASDKYTEIEWCIKATDEAEVDATYEFRVTKRDWLPTSIGGCKLWLRSDLGTTKDGEDRISIRGDQGGNGYDFTQATDAKKPVHTAVGTYYVDHSDDIDDIMACATFNWQGDAGGFTLFVLTKPTDVNEYGYLVAIPQQYGFGVVQYNGTWRVGSNGIALYATDVPCDANYQIISYECVAALPSPHDFIDIIFRKNGGDAATPSCDLIRGVNGTELFNVSVNESSYGGNLHEIIIYNPRISSGDYTTVLDYLAARRDYLNA